MSLLLSVLAFLYALMLFVTLPLPPANAPHSFSICYTQKFDQAVPWYVETIPFVPLDSSDLSAFLVQPTLSLSLFSAPKFYGQPSWSTPGQPEGLTRACRPLSRPQANQSPALLYFLLSLHHVPTT